MKDNCANEISGPSGYYQQQEIMAWESYKRLWPFKATEVDVPHSPVQGWHIDITPTKYYYWKGRTGDVFNTTKEGNVGRQPTHCAVVLILITPACKPFCTSNGLPVRHCQILTMPCFTNLKAQCQTLTMSFIDQNDIWSNQ